MGAVAVDESDANDQKPCFGRPPAAAEADQPTAQAAIYGSLSETYRRCGSPDCRCHHGGPKHGPHLYISYRGKTTGSYIPHHAEESDRSISSAVLTLHSTF